MVVMFLMGMFFMDWIKRDAARVESMVQEKYDTICAELVEQYSTDKAKLNAMLQELNRLKNDALVPPTDEMIKVLEKLGLKV